MDKRDLTAERDLQNVTDMLFDLTASGELIFNLQSATEEQSDTYIAENLMIARPRQELIQSRSFALVSAQHTITEGDDTVSISGRGIVSVGDCEAACDEESTMLCESFAFCRKSGKCVLSPNSVSSSSGNVIPFDSCDVYSRTYISLFVPVDGGVPNKGGDVVRETSDLENCARSCSSLTDFKCQSFAFCGTSHCILKKEHAFTAESTSESKEKLHEIECDLFTGM